MVLEKLKCIGQLFYDISWDENNANCIRNKHGYRNRSKNKQNKKNDRGAKIDFETLAQLKDLATDQKWKQLLIIKPDLTKKSLTTLQQKLVFVFKEFGSVEGLPILDVSSEQYDNDLGFLRVATAYYNDHIRIDRLLGLLDDFGNKYVALDWSDKISKYQLAYLFAQIGETAKEISEFINSKSVLKK
jgi:hypothetical protein